ncbi:TOMM precursor leader peptide-binding protein [Streptomyces sp. NPDC001880]
MAATIRLTGRRLLVVGVGGFGERVAQLLSTGGLGADRVRREDLADAFGARPGAVVLAAQHPLPALGRQADALAWQHGVPWLPVVTEDLLLRIGPWVVPHQGPCFDCYLARRTQHDDQASITNALWEAHEADPGSGPRGFLPQHARTAAGLLHCLLGGPDAVSAKPGSVTAVSLRNGEIDTQPVLRCHGCLRCAPETVPGLDRTGVLAELLGDARTTHQGVPA